MCFIDTNVFSARKAFCGLSSVMPSLPSSSSSSSQRPLCDQWDIPHGLSTGKVGFRWQTYYTFYSFDKRNKKAFLKTFINKIFCFVPFFFLKSNLNATLIKLLKVRAKCCADHCTISWLKPKFPWIQMNLWLQSGRGSLYYTMAWDLSLTRC